MTTYLVTSAPPTPNGDLHVGHLSGPYLAADVFNRFLHMTGRRSAYLLGTDDHQSYVVTTAERLGQDPDELIASAGDAVRSTLAAASIRPDALTGTRDNADHVQFVSDFFALLYEGGIVVPREHGAYWCDSCRRELVESFVHGWCPHCGQPAAGNVCEACGRGYDPLRLAGPTCSTCGSTPSLVRRTTLVVPLDRYRRQLAAFFGSRTSGRPHLAALYDAVLSEPLPDYAASYPASWGIPVPVAGFEDQVVNVWVEMYAGHVHAAHAWAVATGNLEALADLERGDVTLVQFLGHDNAFAYAVVHVAIALALGEAGVPGWPVPEHVVTNEFYVLDGDKFSTSRQHAIWGQDILPLVDADVLRYHLCRTNPEHWQTNFSLSDLMDTYHHELRDCWEQTLGTLFRLATDPVGAGVLPDLQATGLIGWAAQWLKRLYGVKQFSLRLAAAVLLDFVGAAGEYAERAQGTATPAQVAGAAALLQALAILTAPMMPGFAQRLWDSLGLAGSIDLQRWERLGAPFGGSFDRPWPRTWFPAPTLDVLAAPV